MTDITICPFFCPRETFSDSMEFIAYNKIISCYLVIRDALNRIFKRKMYILVCWFMFGDATNVGKVYKSMKRRKSLRKL